MRTALASHQSFFHTNYLFAPFGADLTLHTHTALPALVGATLLRRLTALAALNITVIAGLALNGFCMYLLAWRCTHNRGGAFVAGVIFGGSPYFAAHLNGHFNLTMGWTIPLFAMLVIEALNGSVVYSAIAGVVLGTTAYIDDYYVVYEAVLMLLLGIIAVTAWSVEWRAHPPYRRYVWVALVSIAAIDVAGLTSIVATGGYTIRIGSAKILMNSTFNGLEIFWVLALALVWVTVRPRIRVRRQTNSSARSTMRAVATVVAVSLVVMLPLVWRAIGLFTSGEYVTQQYEWRSAPVGVDIGSVMLGNPFNGFLGGAVRTTYKRFGIDVIESGAWLGIMPLVLAGLTLRRRRTDATVRTWTAVGAFFFVWALGSHLHAFGWNTAMVLPQTLVRFLPIVSNARIPGRAMVVVYLALAMLAATAVADLRERSRHGAILVLLLATAVMADFESAPFQTVAVTCEPTFWALRARSNPGAVAVLPLGLGDGFGDIAPLDRKVLACQPVYQRPVTGGFLARLPPSVVAEYKNDPLLAAWLRLSGARREVVPDAPLPDRQSATKQLHADGIAYLMLNKRTIGQALREYVLGTLPIRQIADDDTYTLFAVQE